MHGADDGGDGVELADRCLDGGRVGEVGLRHDEDVRCGDLPLGLLAAEPVLGVDGSDHRLEDVLVADERLRDERREDRRRVGDARRLDDDPREARDLAARPPVDEVAQSAGTVGYELLCALARRVPVVEAG